jgi:hypothetical protein
VTIPLSIERSSPTVGEPSSLNGSVPDVLGIRRTGRNPGNGKALDHKVPIKDGGKSKPGNVRLKSFSANSARNFKGPNSGK